MKRFEPAWKTKPNDILYEVGTQTPVMLMGQRTAESN